MKNLTYNDGLSPRSRRKKLFVGKGEQIHEFKGQTIQGIVVVCKTGYEKNGKWSNTTYHLALDDAAWHYEDKQSWEEGNWLHPASSTQEAVKIFQNAGCTAQENTIIAFLDGIFPKTMARFRQTEEDLKSLS